MKSLNSNGEEIYKDISNEFKFLENENIPDCIICPHTGALQHVNQLFLSNLYLLQCTSNCYNTFLFNFSLTLYMINIVLHYDSFWYAYLSIYILW